MSFSCQRGGGGGLDHDRGFSVFLRERSNMFVDHWMLDQEGYCLCFSIAILWNSLVLGFQADRLGFFLVGIESWRGEGAQQLPILLLSENFARVPHSYLLQQRMVRNILFLILFLIILHHHFHRSNKIYPLPPQPLLPSISPIRPSKIPRLPSPHLYPSRQTDNLRIQIAIHPKISHTCKYIAIYTL